MNQLMLFNCTTVIVSVLAVCVIDASCMASDEPDPVDFRREVLPLLSDRCFLCHGPDEETQEAGLRLDDRNVAIDYGAIDPDDVDASEILNRMLSDDPDIMMPPPDSGKKQLTAKQVETIRRWIGQGAEYQRHWAFVVPTKSEIPEKTDAWVRNEIDYFVLQRLNEVKQKPSPEASRRGLIRRVSIALTGLPPSRDTIEQLVEDDREDWYERYVDELLASEHYGERMAYVWMDLARYSDTDGFQQDEPRSNWPWRDWVIRAYNDNMPFDQFTIEQFAGDLLPNATVEQKLATCFHRNHMTNGEGGRDPAESRVDYMLDRTNTMGTAWLGLTLGCAQCHTHKYDPITHKEYYQFNAFFNSIDEDGRAGKSAKPYLDYKLPNQEVTLREPIAILKYRQEEAKQARSKAEAEVDAWIEKQLAERSRQQQEIAESDWHHFEPDLLEADDLSVKFKQEPDSNIWRADTSEVSKVYYTLQGKSPGPQVGALRVEALPHKDMNMGGLSHNPTGNMKLTDVVLEVVRQPNQPNDQDDPQVIRLKFSSAWADYAELRFPVAQAIDDQVSTGWGVLSRDMKQPRTAVFQLAEPFEFQEGDQLRLKLYHFAHSDKEIINRFQISFSPSTTARHATSADELLEQLPETIKAVADIGVEQKIKLKTYFLTHHAELNNADREVSNAERDLKNAKKLTAVKVMVLKERAEPRKTYVLERGVWDAHGEEVEPGTPEALNELKVSGDSTASRLDLAKWLVSPENPLVARVAVNRYWQMHFGFGLVRTPEDFGLQGEFPTHLELLDWLAVEFMDSGWDVKHMQRLIVTSATFRQSSKTNAQLLEKDPANRWLARGPRFRLPAALIRDNILASAGLLVPELGGPPVKPYQPPGVWSASDQGKFPYVRARGKDLYRRSLYTYWRRNISPPGLFDAAQRRVCEVQTVRTNSPMHALNLLNDTTYVEAARVLASQAMAHADNAGEQIQWSFLSALARKPDSTELKLLLQLYDRLYSTYHGEIQLAHELLNQGDSLTPPAQDPAALAAMTVVNNAILNLDEVLNQE